MKQRRILLTNLPPMLAGLVRDILSTEPDLEVVSDGTPMGAGSVDFIITTLEGDRLPEPWRHLLERCSATTVLAIRSDATSAVLYELRPHRAPIGDLSPATLVGAIHGAGATGTTND